MKENNNRKHSFPPSFDSRAVALILGSMPGAESLRRKQYYAFAHNAFWRIMGELFSFDPAMAYEARLAALRSHGIALWDVLAACEREGSLDSGIENETPNDIRALLAACPDLKHIFCNGSASFAFLKKHFPELFGKESRYSVSRLPSTSPAAASIAYSAKLEAYSAVKRVVPAEFERES